MERVINTYCAMTVAAIAVYLGYEWVEWAQMKAADWASWVQAVGAIAAIVGAIWISSQQHCRDVERKKMEADRASYLLRAELAWVSGDVLNFINQFSNAKVDNYWVEPVLADDVTDMMNRLVWCRQRVDHKGQLAMIGELRKSLVGMARLAEGKRGLVLPKVLKDDAARIKEFRSGALEVYNAALDINVPMQYRE